VVQLKSGLYVAFLGVDGAGKSTLLQALAANPPAWFNGVSVRHLSPLGVRHHGDVSDPHASPPRGLAMSLLKCGYWFLEHQFGYRRNVAPELAKGWLVLFDRHFVDALVDPRRYRYGGPRWALRLLWRLVPKPDLIVFLDAPVEVIAARKQELDIETMTRLREAYRRFVTNEPRGRIVDVSGTLEASLRNLNDLLAGEHGLAPAREAVTA
jgi:thymidylate kinase